MIDHQMAAIALVSFKEGCGLTISLNRVLLKPSTDINQNQMRTFSIFGDSATQSFSCKTRSSSLLAQMLWTLLFTLNIV